MFLKEWEEAFEDEFWWAAGKNERLRVFFEILVVEIRLRFSQVRNGKGSRKAACSIFLTQKF